MKVDARENFIYFLMGYNAKGANQYGIYVEQFVKMAAIQLSNDYLLGMNLPELTSDEKKYFDQINQWVKVAAPKLKKSMEKLD